MRIVRENDSRGVGSLGENRDACERLSLAVVSETRECRREDRNEWIESNAMVSARSASAHLYLDPVRSLHAASCPEAVWGGLYITVAAMQWSRLPPTATYMHPDRQI